MKKLSIKTYNRSQSPMPCRGGMLVAYGYDSYNRYYNENDIKDELRNLLCSYGFVEGEDYIIRKHGQATAMFKDEETFILAKMIL